MKLAKNLMALLLIPALIGESTMGSIGPVGAHRCAPFQSDGIPPDPTSLDPMARADSRPPLQSQSIEPFVSQALSLESAWTPRDPSAEATAETCERAAVLSPNHTQEPSPSRYNHKRWVNIAVYVAMAALLAASPAYKTWVESWAHDSPRLMMLSLELISIGSKLVASVLAQVRLYKGNPRDFRLDWAMMVRQLAVAICFSALIGGITCFIREGKGGPPNRLRHAISLCDGSKPITIRVVFCLGFPSLQDYPMRPSFYGSFIPASRRQATRI